jgi:hypothetical protein
MERTQEQKRALFDAVISDMEDGSSALSATKRLGLPWATFMGWTQGMGIEYPEAPDKYASAHAQRAEIYFDKILDIALAPSVVNEFGTDKGDVELRKMQTGTIQWVLGKMARKFSDKAHDTEETKSSDLGSITVNLIQDTRPT